MNSERLKREFFTRKTEKIGESLLGKFLCRKLNGEVKKGKIVELELYKGPKDKAAHASDGKTDRNKIVWQEGGVIYTYLIYGLHWMFNIVTAPQNVPECILIRAIDNGSPLKETNGPGKLTDYLNIDEGFYGEDLTESNRIWLEKGNLKSKEIIKTPRINIDYAGSPWVEKKWRYLLKGYQDDLPSP